MEVNQFFLHSLFMHVFLGVLFSAFSFEGKLDLQTYENTVDIKIVSQPEQKASVKKELNKEIKESEVSRVRQRKEEDDIQSKIKEEKAKKIEAKEQAKKVKQEKLKLAQESLVKAQKAKAEQVEKIKIAQQKRREMEEKEARIEKGRQDRIIAEQRREEGIRRREKEEYRRTVEAFLMDLQTKIKNNWFPPEEFAARGDIVIYVQIRISETGHITSYKIMNPQDSREHKAVAASVIRTMNYLKSSPLPLNGRQIRPTTLTITFSPKDVL
jgi:preprotein translocase subunit SecD